MDTSRSTLAALSTEELESFIGQVADDLKATQEQQARLFDMRLAAFKEARRRTPPITQRRLAELADVTEPAVIQQLRKPDPEPAPAP